MSNKRRANTGNYANELRGNAGKIYNELLANNTELQIEPLGNNIKLQNKQQRISEKFHAEPRAKREGFKVEPRANHEKSPDMGRGQSKKLMTGCAPIHEQYSEYKRKSEDSLLLSNEQLVILIQAGKNESDNMILLWNQNQGFINMMARKHAGYAEMDDLCQEGYIALCEAVRHYDTDQSVPFINYAAFWIRQGMQRYIENCCSTVRVPIHAQESIRQYKKIVNEYCKYYGSEPSDTTLCALLHVSQEKLRAIKESVRMGQIRRLDEPLGDDGAELTVGDSVGSGEDMEGDAVQRMDFQGMKERLWEAVDSLPGIQSDVIRCRFLDGKTLKEIGEMDGITIEAVRTQQNKAIRELRKPSRSQKFRGYYEEYIAAVSIHHVGLKSFRCTWTSEVERDAIRRW